MSVYWNWLMMSVKHEINYIFISLSLTSSDHKMTFCMQQMIFSLCLFGLSSWSWFIFHFHIFYTQCLVQYHFLGNWCRKLFSLFTYVLTENEIKTRSRLFAPDAAAWKLYLNCLIEYHLITIHYLLILSLNTLLLEHKFRVRWRIFSFHAQQQS